MYIKQLKDLDYRTDDLRQVFFYRMYTKASGSHNVILDMYENGEITDQDIEMFRFLYDVRFATKQQIIRRCPWLDWNAFDERSKKWIRDRFMNAFMLTDERNNTIQEDAFKIYTIDYVAITLLSHFSSDRDIYNWNPRCLLHNHVLIKQDLLATEFRIACERKLVRRPLSYDSYRMYTFGRFRLIPNAQVFFNVSSTESEVKEKPYLVVAFTIDDFLYGDKTRVDEMIGRYEQWYEEETWKNNFKEIPGILFVCDNGLTADYLKKIMKDRAGAEEDRIHYKNSSAIPMYQQMMITCGVKFKIDLENCFEKYDFLNDQWISLNLPYLEEKNRREVEMYYDEE